MLKTIAKRLDIFISTHMGGGFSVFSGYYDKTILKIIDVVPCSTMALSEWSAEGEGKFRDIQANVVADKGKTAAAVSLAQYFNKLGRNIVLLDYGCGLLGGTISVLKNLKVEYELLLYDADPTVINALNESFISAKLCTNDFSNISSNEKYTDLILWSVDYTLSDAELKEILHDCSLKGASVHILTPFTGGWISRLHFAYLRGKTRQEVKEIGRARSVRSFKKITRNFNLTVNVLNRYYHICLTPINKAN